RKTWWDLRCVPLRIEGRPGGIQGVFPFVLKEDLVMNMRNWKMMGPGSSDEQLNYTRPSRSEGFYFLGVGEQYRDFDFRESEWGLRLLRRTRSNPPNSPGSHRTLRELPRELHHATAFPRAIRHRHTFHDPPTTLQYLLEALETRGRKAGARGRENQGKNLLSGDPITLQNSQVGVNLFAAKDNRHTKRPHLMPPRSCSQRPLTWTPTSQQPPLAANSYSTAAGPISFRDLTCTTPTHTTRLHHTGLTTAITTTTHTIQKGSENK
ncbi:hypothetical protein Taro_022674, partial [Colocasia esculenta]|nr:hypothetical protein [Colocasia esculenta]